MLLNERPEVRQELALTADAHALVHQEAHLGRRPSQTSIASVVERRALALLQGVEASALTRLHFL
eukprot:2314191-Prorocentrum_lima.AAC.1